MTDPHRAAEVTDATDPIQLPEPPGMPRWVKITLVVVGVLALVLIGTAFFGNGGGGHGPGLHGALPDTTSVSAAWPYAAS